ncbi:hypothetical protein Tco_0452442 [Tanacetum coccineum]
MENENPIRTLGDYSNPSHEGYRNTIELPDGNNVVPLRSDTIQLTHLTLMLQIGKGRACVYFNFPFAIKLAIGLNVFQQDPLYLGDLTPFLAQFMDSFQGLTLKIPSNHASIFGSNPNLYDHAKSHHNAKPLNQAAGGKLCYKNAEES